MRGPLITRVSLTLIALVVSCAAAVAQTQPPQKPPKPRSAAKISEKDNLLSILDRQKNAYLSCGDPEEVPSPEVAKPTGTPTLAEAMEEAKRQTAYLEATNKIYTCQRKAFDAALPDLKKTAASDEAIGAAMKDWQKAMNDRLKAMRKKPVESPSPQPGK